MRSLHKFTLLVSLLIVFPAVGQEPLLDEFLSQMPDKGIFQREAKGIRLKSAPLSWKAIFERPNTLWTCFAPFAMSGNFEISTSYNVTSLGVKDQPITDEGNAELSVWFPGYVGYLGINVGIRPQEKDCFNVLRASPDHNSVHFNIVTIPRKSNVGRMGFRRVEHEVIFFVCDGPNVPEVEVVRYPLHSRFNGTPRLSVYQGNGPVPVPVDVLFDQLTLKADQFLRGPEARTPQKIAAPPESYPIQIDYSKNIPGINQDFTRPSGKATDTTVFKAEGNTLRIQPPVSAVHRKEDQAHYYQQSRFSIAGDFELSFRFDVAQLGPIGPDGYGSCAVGMSIETESQIGSVSFSRGIDRRAGDRYSLTRYSPTSKGPNYDTFAFPTKAKAGLLIFRRVGSEITFLAQESNQTELIELMRIPYVSVPIKRIRLYTDQGGSATNPINVVISDLKIKAGTIDDPKKIQTPLPSKTDGVQEPVILEAAPLELEKKKGTSKILFLVGGVLLIGGVILVLLKLRASRRKAA